MSGWRLKGRRSRSITLCTPGRHFRRPGHAQSIGRATNGSDLTSLDRYFFTSPWQPESKAESLMIGNAQGKSASPLSSTFGKAQHTEVHVEIYRIVKLGTDLQVADL